MRELSHTGVDGLFGKPKEFLKPVKTAPFYIFEYLPSVWSTNGGIKVDSHLRAMDKDNVAIPGLYVAGVDQGSSYCVPYYSNPGSSVAIRSVQGHRPHAVLMPLDGLCRISRLQSQDRRVAIRGAGDPASRLTGERLEKALKKAYVRCEGCKGVLTEDPEGRDDHEQSYRLSE
ncbi:FAD-binding protein [Slackia exigua]|uniref:FAD-binding protein n=1 Tax=Slackia exigua TaxID=84109 RepID=UPI003D06B707